LSRAIETLAQTALRPSDALQGLIAEIGQARPYYEVELMEAQAACMGNLRIVFDDDN